MTYQVVPRDKGEGVSIGDGVVPGGDNEQAGGVDAPKAKARAMS